MEISEKRRWMKWGNLADQANNRLGRFMLEKYRFGQFMLFRTGLHKFFAVYMV